MRCWTGARLILLGGAMILALSGCHGRPLRSLAGARLYVSGTESLDRGEVERAIEQLGHAAQVLPHASEIRNHLGLAYWEAGERARAREAFETALVLDCDNEAARWNLAALQRRDALDRTGSARVEPDPGGLGPQRGRVSEEGGPDDVR